MMSRKELRESFHANVETCSTGQIEALHDLAHEGQFYREAGEEFVGAVDEVWEEKFNEGS
jgi:hypothetical protein